MPGLTTAFAQGVAASRPAAATTNAGYVYFATDTGILSQSTGSSWTTIGPAVALDALTTKGDLLTRTSSAYSRLGVGSDAQVLTADSTQSTGVKWATPTSGFSDPLTTRGDLIVRGASSTGRLALGSSGQYLKSDGTDAVWAAAASAQANLNSASSFMTSNLTLTTINTWYDGPSLSLAAGTWIVHATGHLLNNSSAYTISARIWDGTTVYGEAQVTDSTSFANQAVVMARIVLGSTTTIKVSFNSGHAGSTVYATLTNNGTTNKATQIIAFQAA